MAPVSNSQVLESLLDRFQQVAADLPDHRTGSNTRYAVSDAAACALSTFFFQAPSFLEFQRRMHEQSARSNCHALFGVRKIPSDNHIRNLLDAVDPARFADLFPLCLDTVREQGGLEPFLRLDGRLLIALDGIQFQCSDSIHCEQCSTRHVGKHKTPQFFHTMLSASVVADGHNRVLPLMPLFVQPQHDPAAQRPELTEEQRKQDCERNAAKRWLPANMPALLPYRPVLLGDDLYCCQPICELVRELEADFLFICKPSSHKTLYKQLPKRRIWSSSWVRTRNQRKQVEQHRYQWRNNVPVRAGADALKGTWIDFEIRRNGERTYHNSFFTSLKVTADNVAEIARAGRARWKVENETFNCLSRQGYNLKHNFGHGRKGLANLLATLNLFAFALHEVLDCVSDLWRQCRERVGPRTKFFQTLGFLTEWFYFRSWTALFETVLRKRPPPPAAGALAYAPS